MAESIPSQPLRGAAGFTREWSALLECASPSHDLQRLAGLLPSVDWARLLGLAEEHGVVGRLTECVRELPGESVPPEIRQTLIDRRRAQIFFFLRMTAELFRILDRFTVAGIGALVVKGPVLAVQAYGDPAMRSYGDLDLLVRQRDIRRATELMIAAAYAPAVSLRSIDAGKIPGQYLFSKPASNFLIELHNDYTLRYFPQRLPLEDFFARQIRVPLDGRDAPALSVEDELVLICIHGSKHFWERLMWIADVAALVSRQTSIDWGRAANSAREIRAERMLHTGLLLAVNLLKTALPDKVLAMVRSDRQAAHMAGRIVSWLTSASSQPPGLFERAAFRLRMRSGLFAAPAYLLRLSFSPTEEDWKDGPEENRHWFLNVVRRPFRLVRKYGRGGKN